MKSLFDYIDDASKMQQEIVMKPPHIMAEQNDGKEELWNTTGDRWSRKAKHQMNTLQKALISDDWEQGDKAIYEGVEVEIKIPRGPNSTVGILFEGKTKMVSEAKLERIDEWVMGGVQSLSPINRIMQLAGISTPVLVGHEIEQDVSEQQVPEEEVLVEADPFKSIMDQNVRKYANKASPEAAASLATIGEIMVMLKDQVDGLKTTVPAEQLTVVSNMLKPILPLGANIMSIVDDMPEKAREDEVR